MYSFFLSTFCLRFHTYCSEATREAQAREQAREAQGPGSTVGPKGKGRGKGQGQGSDCCCFPLGFALCSVVDLCCAAGLGALLQKRLGRHPPWLSSRLLVLPTALVAL